jgi:hypothetical protein
VVRVMSRWDLEFSGRHCYHHPSLAFEFRFMPLQLHFFVHTAEPKGWLTQPWAAWSSL